ncbi:MAG: putative zinc-binding protein [Proteobacteria bacterium]|nr:putative zinc-binding protein [Pseudomonadota bacterium]
MAEECCSPSEILIFTCSGSSNVGQVANQAAVDLQQEGIGKMLCLAGIGGHVSGMIASAQSAKRLVGIDGCSVACTKKTMEHVGLSLTDYVLITALGYEKGPYSGTMDKKAVDKIKDEMKKQIVKPIKIEVK